MSASDDDEHEAPYPRCAGCPVEPPGLEVLARHLAPLAIAALPTNARLALGVAARCLERTGDHIDRAHVEDAMAALGEPCWVL